MTKPISNIAGKSRSNITSSSNPAETGTDHEPHGLAQPIELVASTEQTAIHRPSFVTSIDLLKTFRLPDPAALLNARYNQSRAKDSNRREIDRG